MKELCQQLTKGEGEQQGLKGATCVWSGVCWDLWSASQSWLPGCLCAVPWAPGAEGRLQHTVLPPCAPASYLF